MIVKEEKGLRQSQLAGSSADLPDAGRKADKMLSGG